MRSDLVGLSDAELAARCEALWAEIGELEADRCARWHASGTRGPIRHRRAYLFWGTFRQSGGGLLDALASVLVSSPKAGDRLVRSRAVSLHLALCEVQDVVDEMKARSAAKRKI